MPPPGLRDRILEQIPESERNTVEAGRVADMLLAKEQWRVFGPVDPADCTVEVDFEVIGELEPVSELRVLEDGRPQGAADPC